MTGAIHLWVCETGGMVGHEAWVRVAVGVVQGPSGGLQALAGYGRLVGPDLSIVFSTRFDSDVDPSSGEGGGQG